MVNDEEILRRIIEIRQPSSHGIVDLLSQTILSKQCPTSRHTLGTSLKIRMKITSNFFLLAQMIPNTNFATTRSTGLQNFKAMPTIRDVIIYSIEMTLLTFPYGVL